MNLFPFADYWWFYSGFTVFVLVVLALDLGVFHRQAHEVKFREALTWSIVWVVMAVVFGWLFGKFAEFRFFTIIIRELISIIPKIHFPIFA